MKRPAGSKVSLFPPCGPVVWFSPVAPAAAALPRDYQPHPRRHFLSENLLSKGPSPSKIEHSSNKGHVALFLPRRLQLLENFLEPLSRERKRNANRTTQIYSLLSRWEREKKEETAFRLSSKRRTRGGKSGAIHHPGTAPVVILARRKGVPQGGKWVFVSFCLVRCLFDPRFLGGLSLCVPFSNSLPYRLGPGDDDVSSFSFRRSSRQVSRTSL